MSRIVSASRFSINPKYVEHHNSCLFRSLSLSVTGREKTRLSIDFVNQAHRRWANRYDYSEARESLKHFYARVAIICSSHGRFFTTPKSHLSGEGCPKCDRKDARHAEQWKSRAAALRGCAAQRALPGKSQTLLDP